jgi:DNA polymerase III subunit beta
MKFTCNKKELMKSVIVAKKVINRNASWSIVSNVLLGTENDQLLIMATDHHVHFESHLLVTTNEDGSVLMPCNELLAILKGLPDGDVVVSSTIGDKGRASVNISVINYPDINCSVVGKSAENFPTKDEPSDSEFFSVPNGIVERMISKVLFSVSDDTTRVYMCGVHLIQEANYFTMVSTNGRILSITKEMVSGILDFQGVTIPPKVLKIIKSISDGKSMMSIAIVRNDKRDGESIHFRLGNMKFSSNLIEPPYPSYNRVIPDSRKFQISVDRNSLVQSVKRASITSKPDTRMSVTIGNGVIDVCSWESGIGATKESLPISNIGEHTGATTLVLSHEYLIGLLSLCDGDEIMISYDDKYESIIIEDKSKTHKHLIMPMQPT